MKSNIFSFSIQPKYEEYRIAVDKLKNYSHKTGISFSFLIAKAVKSYVEELKL